MCARHRTITYRERNRVGYLRHVSTGGDGGRDLIRQDMKRQDDERLELLRTELERAFAASDDTYKALNAETFLARHRGERWCRYRRYVYSIQLHTV